ncbi:hypothetical protein P7K49_024834 [Saguinus oedipus]|uniref:Uncharacterized protein n=1 Tax=Saguinus oedipus TaxID=9490 RepID=A0ABQ9US97_SAGOE|nr:hypothetical protein P7K49_024834 [Saguinus oedipus]
MSLIPVKGECRQTPLWEVPETRTEPWLGWRAAQRREQSRGWDGGLPRDENRAVAGMAGSAARQGREHGQHRAVLEAGLATGPRLLLGRKPPSAGIRDTAILTEAERCREPDRASGARDQHLRGKTSEVAFPGEPWNTALKVMRPL